MVALYAVLLLSMGLLISWAAPACNNPVFAGGPCWLLVRELRLGAGLPDGPAASPPVPRL